MKTNQNLLRFNINFSTKAALQLGCLLAAGMFLSGCNEPASPPPSAPSAASAKAASPKAADFAGVYALVSVNGKNVPTSVSHDGTGLQVRSGSFTINADGTCGTKTVFVPPSGQEATREVSATYTQDGAKLTMQWKGAGMTVGTVDGNTFTMDNEGMIFVYRK